MQNPDNLENPVDDLKKSTCPKKKPKPMVTNSKVLLIIQ